MLTFTTSKSQVRLTRYDCLYFKADSLMRNIIYKMPTKSKMTIIVDLRMIYKADFIWTICKSALKQKLLQTACRI